MKNYTFSSLFCLTCMSHLSSVATYILKCNNHNVTDAIAIFPGIKMKLLQYNVKPFDIKIVR